MVLHFTKSLQEALEEISFDTEYSEFVVHEHEEVLDKEKHVGFLERYGEAKWGVVDLLNSRYSNKLRDTFDLYNWLHYNTNDEVAYFLSEVGSNCLNYSSFKAPHKFHVWLGKKGFVIGISQKGEGFSALQVEEKKIKENEGAAFEFFRRCRSEIFFDDATCARMVYMKWKF